MIIEQEICNMCGGPVVKQSCMSVNYTTTAMNDILTNGIEYSFVLCEKCISNMFKKMEHKPKMYDILADMPIKK